MPRTSRNPHLPLGVSLSWDGDSLRVKLKREDGTYASKAFSVAGGFDKERDALPFAVRTWLDEGQRRLREGENLERRTLLAVARLWIEDQTGLEGGRAALIDKLAVYLDGKGVRDLGEGNAWDRARKAIEDMQPGWHGGAAKPLSNGGRNQMLKLIRAVFIWGQDRGWVRRVPKFKRFPHTPRGKQTFTVEELRKALGNAALWNQRALHDQLHAELARNGNQWREAAKTCGIGIHKAAYHLWTRETPGADPWWMAFAAMTYAGLRPAEAAHFRWEWINWEGHVLRLAPVYDERGGVEFDLKDHEERTVAMQPELIDALRLWARANGHAEAPRRGYLFDEAMRRRGSTVKKHKGQKEDGDGEYYAPFRRFLERVGIDPARLGPYSLRHTYARLRRAMGHTLDDIKDDMGHADAATTAGYAGVKSKAWRAYVEPVKGWTDGFHLRRPVIAPLDAEPIVILDEDAA